MHQMHMICEADDMHVAKKQSMASLPDQNGSRLNIIHKCKPYTYACRCPPAGVNLDFTLTIPLTGQRELRTVHSYTCRYLGTYNWSG